MKIAAEDTFFQKKNFLNCNGRLLDFSTPKVMGILNLTPDSFYDGGKTMTERDGLHHVEKLVDEGAVIIDVGAQSTRPGAKPIDAEEEWKRLEPMLKLIVKEFSAVVISVDTFYSEIARRSVSAGAGMINDVSGGSMDALMFQTIAKLGVPYVLMHMKGTPQTMQQDPQYENVVKEINFFFSEKIQQLTALGAHDIVLDPGFGFGKTLEHNFELLRNLDLFKMHGRPVLAGLSRKSMVNKVVNTKAADALNGTTVLNTIALLKGVDLLRVHDVKEAMECIQLVAQL